MNLKAGQHKHRLFFNSIERLKADLRIVQAKDEFLAPGTKAGGKFRAEAWFRLIIQAIISFGLLTVGLYILTSPKFDQDVKKIASGFIGTVIGYWLS